MKMSKEEWQSIHDKYETCVMSMVMHYKTGDSTSVQLFDLIENYCEEAFMIGYNKNQQRARSD